MKLIIINRYLFSKVSDSLKVLQLTPPITKKQIKTKYFQLVKSVHPDHSQKKQQNNVDLKQNQAFIQITKAYKHLLELSQQQINNPQEQRKINQNQQYFSSKMHQEKQNRSHSYSYFNRGYKRPQGDRMQKIPLYKSVPQLFLGYFFVLLFLIQWANMAYQQHVRSQSKDKKVQTKSDQSQINNFQSLNFKKRYQKRIQE